MSCKGHCACRASAIEKYAARKTANEENLSRRKYRVTFRTSDGINQEMDILATSEEDATLQVRTQFTNSTIFTCLSV